MPLTVNDIEYMIAEKDFFEWLKYVKILEPFPGRGSIPFEAWPHLMEVGRALQSHQLIAWLKSRQLGCSWFVAAYTLHMALYNEGVHIPEMAQTEDKAKELILKQKHIYNNLPPELQRPVKSMDNQLEMIFTENDSWIRAYPSTKDAVRGLTGSCVWFDECDFQEYFDAAFSTAKATVDDIGGQIILTSTSNPDTAMEGSLFKSIYSDANARGFYSIFYGWDSRPDRDEAWYAKVKKESSDPFTFTKEHAFTAEEALAPPLSAIFFDHNILNEMKTDVREPLQAYDNIEIFQKPSMGSVYVAGTDTAHGVGGDFSVTVVANAKTGYVCAHVMTQFLPPKEFTATSLAMLKLYDNPLWAIEDNDWGCLVVQGALDMNYPALYESNPDSPGWHTGVHNRFLMWGELQEAIHNRALIIPSETGLKQFYTIIRNPKKQSRAEAQGGQHDDYPMALAILWQARKEARIASRGSSKTPVFLKVN